MRAWSVTRALTRLAPDAISRRLAAYFSRLARQSAGSEEIFFAQVIDGALADVLWLYDLRRAADLRKAAATTLGSVIEDRLLRSLGLAQGLHLDALALGHEVELKWSMRQRYEFRPKQFGKHCLFVGLKHSRFHVGVFRADATRGGLTLLGEPNGDDKRAFTPALTRVGAVDRAAVVAWIVRDAPLPALGRPRRRR